MIRAWLDMSSAGIFLVLIGLYFGMTLLLAALTFCRPFARSVQSLTGVVAPFFSGVAILFALLTGFLASDVAERGRQAYRVVHAEAGELRNIHTLSVASVSDMRTIRRRAQDLCELSGRGRVARDERDAPVAVHSGGV